MTRSLVVNTCHASCYNLQEGLELIRFASFALRHVDIIYDTLTDDRMLAQVPPFQRRLWMGITTLEVSLVLIALPGMNQVEQSRLGVEVALGVVGVCAVLRRPGCLLSIAAH
jgi:hypothetical protein